MKPLSPAAKRRLVRAARAAAARAHAPYSGYFVGAALLVEGGGVVTGCNVENASYGLTICAERNAVFAMVARGGRRVRAVAVAARGDAAPWPCGACRQVLAEFAGPETPVLVATGPSAWEETTLGELLPRAFQFPK